MRRAGRWLEGLPANGRSDLQEVRVHSATVIRAALVAAAAALLAGPAVAQAPPSFAAQAELVTVDAVVLGPDGKPVAGLTRDDFLVKEDGRPQALRAFEAVEAALPALEFPETVGASPAQARVATNVAGPATRRTFAIVFDDLHVGDANVEEAKRAVARFAERLVGPGDRLVLFTVFDARYWSTTRGAGDEGWMQALHRVRSHRLLRGRPGCEPTYYEAMQIDLLGNKQVADLVQRRYAAICVPRRCVPARSSSRAPGRRRPVHSPAPATRRH